MNNQENAFQDFEVIYSYTREQALEDGQLVDVTDYAKEFRIRFPMALTIGVFSACVQTKDGEMSDEEEGLLKNVIVRARNEMMKAKRGQDRVNFRMDLNGIQEELIVHVGPGDKMEPVLTVMFPNEN